jgi:tetratricopeptide (TPR) repeat protein
MKALSIAPDFALAAIACGDLAFGAKEYEVALDAYDHAIATDDRYAEAHLGRGMTLFSTMRSITEIEPAIASFRRALELDEGCVKAMLGLGALLKSSSDIDGARELAVRAVQLEPENLDAVLFYAQVMAASRNPQEAFGAYSAALRIAPDSIEALNGHAWAAVMTDNAVAADLSLQRSMQLNPDLPHTLSLVGLLLASQGKTQEALTFLGDAIERHQDATILYEMRAAVYDQIGDQTNAQRDRETLARLTQS